MTKYEKHQVIEVSHQYGVKVWECESFWEVAINDGDLNSVEYATIEDARESFGDDIPAELAAILNSGETAIEVWEDGEDSVFCRLGGFDKERFAIDVLGSDLNNMIIIDSKEEAQYIADHYRGHEEGKVRDAALRIITINE